MSIASGRPRALVKRLLFPALPLDAPLPRLVGSGELSGELYEVVALGLRGHVLPWWSKISRYDKQLLPETTRVLAAAVRTLAARIDAVDLAPLLLVHGPALLAQHYRDYRTAHRKLHTSYAPAPAASLPQLFHQLQPHIAVSPDGRLHPEYFRHLLDHVLSVCLPPEDYRPDAERLIVREILLKVLLNDVIPKITQPSFVHRSILHLLQAVSPSSFSPELPQQSPESPPPSTSSHTIIIFVLSAIQAVSGACLALIHAYKITLSTIRRVNKPNPAPSHHYAHPLLSALSEIFTLQDRTASTTLLTTARIIAVLSSPFLDRLLPHLLESHLSPAFVLSTTRTAKRTLFPNGDPAPAPIDPTPDEQADFHARLVHWRPRGALATRLLPLLLGPDPSNTLEAALDPLSSTPCNVHLVLFLFDLVVLQLFPELALPASNADPHSLARDGDSVTRSEAS